MTDKTIYDLLDLYADFIYKISDINYLTHLGVGLVKEHLKEVKELIKEIKNDL